MLLQVCWSGYEPLALLVWQLLDVLMLVFGAVIVATVLRALSDALERRVHVPPQWSVAAGLLLLAAATTLGLWLVGEPLAQQFETLRQRLPAAIAAVMGWLNSQRFGVTVLQYIDHARNGDASPWALRAAGVAGSTLGAIGGAGLMLATRVRHQPQ